MWSLPAAQRAIILAGCLAAAYNQLTTSPATVEFARSLGADEFHMGILGALPTLMLFFQFLAAVIVNHLHYRRWLWFGTALVHRLLLLPVALGPWLWPDVPGPVWVTMLLMSTAVNQALLHFSSPLWLSWMGDYLPHAGLSEFWGRRQFWMQWTAAATLALAATARAIFPTPVQTDFTVQIVVGTVLGVVDLLFFFWVEEPRVKPAQSPHLREVLAEPFRHRDFRRFIGFTCFWHFAAMAGAPFISLFLMTEIGMDLCQVLWLWTASWVGGACCSKQLGRLTDEYGSRPMLIVCVAFKSINMLALLLVPRDPWLAFWLLVPVFMVDQVLNVGILIANNGFMIKNSPAENRTMFIAASTAVAGLVGGITSIAAGWLLVKIAMVKLTVLGGVYGHFHIMFAASVLLRWIALVLVHDLREPRAQSVSALVRALLATRLATGLATGPGRTWQAWSLRWRFDPQQSLAVPHAPAALLTGPGPAPPVNIGAASTAAGGRSADSAKLTCENDAA